MATRKQHPRITFSSSPEQGELNEEDLLGKEKDAALHRNREAANRSKTSQSSTSRSTASGKPQQRTLHVVKGPDEGHNSRTRIESSANSTNRDVERSSFPRRESRGEISSSRSERSPPRLHSDVRNRLLIPAKNLSPVRRGSRDSREHIPSTSARLSEKSDSSPKRALASMVVVPTFDEKVKRQADSSPPVKKSPRIEVVEKAVKSDKAKLERESHRHQDSRRTSRDERKSGDVEKHGRKTDSRHHRGDRRDRTSREEDKSTTKRHSSPHEKPAATLEIKRKNSSGALKVPEVKKSVTTVAIEPELPSKSTETDGSPITDSNDDTALSDSGHSSDDAKSEVFGIIANNLPGPAFGPPRSRFESGDDVYGLQELPPVSPEEMMIVEEPEVPDDSGLPPYFPGIHGCRSVDEFECINRIEEGTYGVVYRARDKRTNEVIALKRLKMEKEKEGFPITSLREVSTLLKAHHPNVVAIREVVVGHNMDKIYMVMEFVEHDLKALMETMRQPFSIGEVKTLMRQLLSAVRHLHDNWIIHRDLKTSNLLLNHRGILKVGDFGLAREYGSPLRPYTPVVVTLWYRAPELLLGMAEYSTHIDIWSVGCIFAEFLTLKPLFPGKSEIEQLNKIFKELGNPSEANWPGYNDLPLVKQGPTFVTYPNNLLRKRFPATVLTNSGYDLLTKLLEYNPKKRVTADEALKHTHFVDVPLPVDPSMFPTWPARSEQKSRGPRHNTPRPPSGGKLFKETADADGRDGADGFRIGQSKESASHKGEGFRLKF